MQETARHGVHTVRTLEPGPPATGRREQRDGLDWVVYVRRLAMPVAEAWEALTAPEQLANWVGTWHRAPGEESGTFRFAYEGDDVRPLSYRLERLEPPRRIAVVLSDPSGLDPWRLDLAVADVGGWTELTVRQSIPNPALAPAAAAGCEFYLDRLVAMVEGGDMDALDFDAYFIRQAAHYRSLFPVRRSGRDR